MLLSLFALQKRARLEYRPLAVSSPGGGKIKARDGVGHDKAMVKPLAYRALCSITQLKHAT